VILRWRQNAEPDLDHDRLYRAEDPAYAMDLHSMTLRKRLTAAPDASPRPGEELRRRSSTTPAPWLAAS
jgi:hypothetical protein